MARMIEGEDRYLSSGEDNDEEEMAGKDITDEVQFSDDPLPEGIYSMAIASTIRDSRRIAIAWQENDAFPCVRCMRLCVSLLLVCFLISLQFWLTIETKRLVSPLAVHDIRDVYSKYEEVMYTDAQGVEHLWFNENDKPRGYAEYFNESNFDLMDQDEKDTVCMIPLAKPNFTLVILFIWVITCMGEIRRTLNLAMLMWTVPRVQSMADALSFDDVEADAGEARLAGLILSVKALILGGFLVPRFFLTLYLMWLGCRWLLATTGFADVLLNSIALEFILLLQDALYLVLVPAHTKKETEGTMLPASLRSEANCSSFFNTFVLAFLSVAFVVAYFYGLQKVLPDYQWDVAKVCRDYLADRMKV